MWTGSLAFGLVNVPVKMYTATQDHTVRFHQVHLADGGRIRMKRICSVCGEEVAFRDIGKGHEEPTGQRIMIHPDELEDMPTGPDKEIEVLEFVPTDQVDPIMLDKTYYLEPDGRASKPYVLLREALEQTERTAIVRIAIRQRTQLAALRVREDVLVLQTMLWPDEIREPDFAFRAEQPAIRPQELQMAQSLIENLSADFDPSQYTDSYREAILALIDSKLAGDEATQVPEVAEAADTGAVVDLMAALQASVERTNQSGGASGKAEPARQRTSAKSAASTSKPAAARAKKAATKSAAAKPAVSKSAAKKTTTAKSAAGRTSKSA